MRQKILFSLVVFLVLVTACSSTKKDVEAMQVKFPGEDLSGFKKITRDDQSITGPEIVNNKGKLSWYTGSLFDVSNLGDKIVYTAAPTSGSKTACVFVKALGNDQMLVQRTSDVKCSNPAFSPDDSSLCFSAQFMDKDKGNICIINTYEGTAIQYLTETQSGNASAPVFSSNGTRIFYTRAFPQTEKSMGENKIIWKYMIWSVDMSDAITMQYVEGSSPEYVNSEKLLYTKMNPLTYQGEIWLLDIKSGLETLVLADKKRGFSTPRVSPDGKKILCVGLTNSSGSKVSNLDIYSANIDGSDLHQLTFFLGTDASPCWAPDGKTIYFISQRGNGKNVYNIWSADLPAEP
jgi:Tol biopolymer transport system component